MIRTLHAYGRFAQATHLRQIHPLPERSTSRVIVGDVVEAGAVLAAIELPREHHVLDISVLLDVPRSEAETYLVKRRGDIVEMGESIAERRVFLGLGRRRVLAPTDGRVVHVRGGQVLIEGQQRGDEIYATVPGRVVAVEPGLFITVLTLAGVAQLVWGSGGRSSGTLWLLSEDPSLSADPAELSADHRGAIVAIGAPLSDAFLRRAASLGVAGLIAASMPAALLEQAEAVGFPIGVTQGFGSLAMSRTVFELLKAYHGWPVMLDASLSANWRRNRPKIIIPLEGQQRVPPVEYAVERGLVEGQRVRVLQAPHLGAIGVVQEIPREARQLASGLWATGAEIELESGERAFVPVANLEHLG
jgi:hypothetical protein